MPNEAMLTRIGDAADFAEGRMRVFDIAGTNVAVVKVNSELYAFDDACTHRQCSLAEGQLRGTTVTCPCHGSKFDVTTGNVLRGPAVQRVRSRAVRMEDGDVFVET